MSVINIQKNVIKFHQFNHLAHMPKEIYRVCRTMGHISLGGHLLEIINTYEDNRRRFNYNLRSAYVMEVDGKVIGWACLYTISYSNDRYVSVWIQTRHRRKGYGKLLIGKAYKAWNRYKPVKSIFLSKRWKPIPKSN